MSADFSDDATTAGMVWRGMTRLGTSGQRPAGGPGLPPLFAALAHADERLAEFTHLQARVAELVAENRELRDALVDAEVSTAELFRANRDFESQIKHLTAALHGCGQQ